MTEFKEKSRENLTQEVRDKRRALREFRFSIAGSKTRNVREGRNLRKEIARLLTEINRRIRSNG